ncbi:MAG: hypothetical protein ACLFVK_05695 [Dehalococcoidia bacterium]
MSNWKTYLGIGALIVALMFSIACVQPLSPSSSQSPQNSTIWIPDMSTALGSVDGEGNQQRFSYTLSLCNRGADQLYVSWIEPVLSAEVSPKVLTEELKVTIEQGIEPGDCTSAEGEFILNTEGMSRLEIMEMEPFMTRMKINGEMTLELPGLGQEPKVEESSSLPPVPPSTFMGTAYLNGEPVAEGIVTAFVEGSPKIVETSTDADGQYYLQIQGNFQGKEVTFKVNGVDAQETAEWGTGTTMEQNLHAEQ